MTLVIATTIDEALHAMANGSRPIAGGTDLVVGHRQGKSPLPDSLVAIDRIPELARIEETADSIRIGAGVTHAQLMADDLVATRLSAIGDAAALVGSPATRNVGSIGGNVMNGSPAMDTGAPLMVLGAKAELRTRSGTRLVDLDELWIGPGTVSAGADELCTALVVPVPPASAGSAYVRLEYRRAMEIAVVGAAASIELDGDQIAAARVALTAVAPTIVEVASADLVEAGLVGAVVNSEAGNGHALDVGVMDAVGRAVADSASPISDLRASDRYRRHTVGVMARRAIAAAVRRARGEQIAVPVNRSIGIGAS